MKNLFFPGLLLFSLFTSGQRLHPDAEDVIREFYKHYTVDAHLFPSIQLEKRNESWFVYAYSLENGKPEPYARQLFYDAKRAAFETLSFPRKTNTDTSEVTRTLLNTDVYNFNVHASYGYTGWYKDIISMYSNAKDATAEQLHSLARAYSEAANARLGRQLGFAEEAELFHAPFRLNSLSEAQVDKYLDMGWKAVETFRKVASLNPHYKTRVGDIGMKSSNELMVLYHNILVYAPQYLKKLDLPDNLYHPDSLRYCRAYLESCPRNSIFLSFGDNDFYPFLYLQAKGLRPDVHLINYSLLGMDRYIYRATHPYFAASPVRISFDTSHYGGDKNAYIRLTGNDQTLRVADLAALIKKNKTAQPLELAAGAVEIQMDKKVKKIALQGAYLLKEQLLLLDILNNLNGRKICFPSGFNDQLTDLNQFLIQKDSVWVFDN